MEIRVLARQGMSIRAIAQQLRVSRNTVRKYLRNPGLPIYPNRAARPTKLDPFKPYLQARIQAAKPHWIPATVLLRELREHGYTGGLSQLRIPVKLNSDSGICEHHFRKVCGQGFFEQKLSFEGRHLFDSLNKPAAKRSAAVVDPRRWNRTVHLTSEYVH